MLGSWLIRRAGAGTGSSPSVAAKGVAIACVVSSRGQEPEKGAYGTDLLAAILACWCRTINRQRCQPSLPLTLQNHRLVHKAAAFAFRPRAMPSHGDHSVDPEAKLGHHSTDYRFCMKKLQQRKSSIFQMGKDPDGGCSDSQSGNCSVLSMLSLNIFIVQLNAVNHILASELSV